MNFGDILRNLLNDRGITQKQLAAELNIAPTTMGNYFRNNREPDFATLKLLADYFSVSTDYLLNHRTIGTETHKEDELLQIYRAMTPPQQELLTEQGKLIIRLSKK